MIYRFFTTKFEWVGYEEKRCQSLKNGYWFFKTGEDKVEDKVWCNRIIKTKKRTGKLRCQQDIFQFLALKNIINIYFHSILLFNCSDPLEGGGTIYSTGFFFVPWIFAARYIHRRELRLVSLESSSSVEYGIKKIFLIFVFYRELSRLKLLRKEEWIHVVFIHIFRNFCLNFRQFC